MIRRTLGSTGISVSELAFGCVEIGMPYGIGVYAEAGMPGRNTAIHLLQQALDSGINFFDTARMYGISETLLGQAFRHRRHEVVIATKCRHFLQEDGSLPDPGTIRRLVMDSLRESMQALQTSYVDVFMLHQADRAILASEAVQAVFSDLKTSGAILATGVSTYTNRQTETALQAGMWNVIQVPFNLMDQRQQALFAQAAASGTALVIRLVLLKGLLSTRGTGLHPALAPVVAHIEKYGALTGRLHVSLATLAIRFALSFAQASSVLVGIDHPDYLREALAAAGGQYLDGPLLQEAQELAYPDPAFLDLARWHREGWLL